MSSLSQVDQDPKDTALKTDLLQPKLESERKYLFSQVPKEIDLSFFPSVEIEQAYLPFKSMVAVMRVPCGLFQEIVLPGGKVIDIDMTETPEQFNSLWNMADAGCDNLRMLPSNATIRIRRKGEKLLQTFKWDVPQGQEEEDAKKRTELEFPITQEQYSALSGGVEGAIIKKTRYTLMDSHFEVVLDVFHLQLEGLVMAEIEQKGNLGFDSLIMPGWFNEKGRIVSEDSRFTNAALSRTTSSEAQKLVTQYATI